MSGRFEELVGVSGIDTGEYIYRDDSIDAGTRGLVDMGWTWGGGSQDLGINATVKNLCWIDDPYIARAALPAIGGGVAHSGVNSYGLLPEGFMFRPTDRHMLLTIHARFATPGPAAVSYNSRIFDFRTSANSQQLAMIPTIDANGALVNIEIATQSFGWPLLNVLSGLFDDAKHQFAIELITSADGLHERISLWLDGLLLHETDYVPHLAIPAPAPGDRPRFGNWVNFANGFTGRFYRARMDDLTRTDRSAADILNDDAAVALGRFS